MNRFVQGHCGHSLSLEPFGAYNASCWPEQAVSGSNVKSDSQTSRENDHRAVQSTILNHYILNAAQ